MRTFSVEPRSNAGRQAITRASSAPNPRARRFLAPSTVTPPLPLAQSSRPSLRLPRVDSASIGRWRSACPAPPRLPPLPTPRQAIPPSTARSTATPFPLSRVASTPSSPFPPRAQKPRRHRRFSPESSSPVNSPATVYLRPKPHPEHHLDVIKRLEFLPCEPDASPTSPSSSRRAIDDPEAFTEPLRVILSEHRRPTAERLLSTSKSTSRHSVRLPASLCCSHVLLVRP